MFSRPARRVTALAAGLMLGPLLQGCATLATSAASGLADNLSAAILEQDDPELVRAGAPAFLLLLDSLAAGSPGNPELQSAAARLYAAYAVTFVSDEVRAARLASRAREYGRQAVCAADRRACRLDELGYDEYLALLERLAPRTAEALFSYAIGSLAWLRTHSDDWGVLTGLPRIERTLERLLVIGPDDLLGSVNLYLGILNSLRPPALGGRPEVGRAYFERALELTGRNDLSVHVEFARNYARLVYDRELHDALLQEVLDRPVAAPGLTLFNTLAREQALELLAETDEFF